MAQFTQLDLNRKSTGTRTTEQQSQSSNRTPTLALVGTLLATAFAGAFLLESSACSKNNKPIAAAKSEPSAVSQAAIQPPPLPATEKKPAKKSPRQSTRAIYSNPDYGISMVYPKNYTLRQGDEAALEWAGLGPVQMNFARPDGESLAAIELPKDSYPETDFASGFVNISVHPKMAAEECSEFAFPATTGNHAAKPAPARIGDMEFSTIEATAGDDSKQADAKYYHLAQNGACYEFALGVQTSRDGDLDMAQVDRVKVFNRLKRILTTVKVKPVEENQPEQKPVAAASQPDGPSISQK